VDEHFAEILDDSIARASPGDDDAWGYDLVAWKEQTSPTEMGTDDSGVARVEEAKPAKPYALVITSDDESQEDIFYYGIQHPIHAMGLLCERVVIKCITSQSETTKYHLERMEDAKIVVCDVSIVSPLLYFYLGYAMGKHIPTVLISKNTANRDFDENHYDTIQYSKIWELEERLRQWLKRTLEG
jgi:hypothetical protein